MSSLPIRVRRYVPQDGRILRPHYPFGERLPSSWGGYVSKAVVSAIAGRREERLVAIRSESGQPIGVVTSRKITSDLWEIGNAFVLQDFRGKGVAQQLYKSAFSYLHGLGARKAVASVAASNVSSIRSIQKCYDGFLPIIYYYAQTHNKAAASDRQSATTETEIKMVEPSRLPTSVLDRLYHTYVQCVDARSVAFLNLGKPSFFRRLIDHPPHSTGMFKPAWRRYAVFDSENIHDGFGVISFSRLSKQTLSFLYVPREFNANVVRRILVGMKAEWERRGGTGLLTLVSSDRNILTGTSPLRSIKAVKHLVASKQFVGFGRDGDL